MSAVGSVGEAVIYAAQNVFSWSQSLLVPGIQALAQIKILEKQNDFYQDLRADQKSDIDFSLSNYFSCLENLIPFIHEAYPDIPEAIAYTPVDPCQVQCDTIQCNIDNIGRGATWANCIDRHHEQSDITRAIALDPRWLVNMDLYSTSINDLLRGRLPTGDLVRIVKGGAEKAAFMGRIGGVGHMTLQDIGMGQLEAQREGRDALEKETVMMERISPTGRHKDIGDMMQSPRDRIALALTQMQLLQNSAQNIANKNAQKSPALMAELQLRIERCINTLQLEASKANLGNNVGVDYASVLTPIIAEVGNRISQRMPVPRQMPRTSHEAEVVNQIQNSPQVDQYG